MGNMQKQEIENRNKPKKKVKDSESKEEEETWEPPIAPPDVYSDVMSKFLSEAQTKTKELCSTFDETKTNCEALVKSLGEKLTDKYTLSDFWGTLNEIRGYWDECQNTLQKIEDEKAKKAKKEEKKRLKREKKKRMEEKLKRR